MLGSSGFLIAVPVCSWNLRFLSRRGQREIRKFNGGTEFRCLIDILKQMVYLELNIRPDSGLVSEFVFCFVPKSERVFQPSFVPCIRGCYFSAVASCFPIVASQRQDVKQKLGYGRFLIAVKSEGQQFFMFPAGKGAVRRKGIFCADGYAGGRGVSLFSAACQRTHDKQSGENE
jgi:hypothetical protein